MYTRLESAAVLGLNCEPVHVEIDVSGSWPGFQIVGLPDPAIKEAKERIRTAWKNSDLPFPGNSRIIINLAPADIRKEGTAYDLPMALGMYLSANKRVSDLNDALFVGELSLDGSLRHTNGILPLAIYAKETGFKRLFLPKQNSAEAALIKDLLVYPVETFRQLLEHLEGDTNIKPHKNTPHKTWFEHKPYQTDFKHVKGQEFVKRALEIAASGGHNILLSGPPGAGKTMLARTIPSILPKLTINEAIEVTKIYSIAGKLPSDKPLITTRPFRTPHHSASGVSLVGGGAFPSPGEISLAHRGVLFLDELPEFPRKVIENLRQPLEDGIITISRAQGTLSFPASFTLVASQNPCPCGYATDPHHECTCTALQRSLYKKKVSGPTLDRIDLHIEVPPVKLDKLSSSQPGEASKIVRTRVEMARQTQQKRFSGLKTEINSEMTTHEVEKFCKLTDKARSILTQAADKLNLSARSYTRVLKVSRTIADIAGQQIITQEHIAESMQFRAK